MKNNGGYLINQIQKISSMDNEELNKLANDARRFVVNEKNWTKQTEKIHNFLIKN